MNLICRFTLTLCLVGLVSALPATAHDGVREYNKGPRILFNAGEKAEIKEVLPGNFFLDYWHGPHMTIVHSRFVRGEKGHVQGVASIHGEEVVYLISGHLKFEIGDQTYDLKNGDFFHIPDEISHLGSCLSDECHFVTLFTPPRPDYGPEGSPMTKESNDWLANEQPE
ncbi:MAG: cupin domain-containing protein [Gammaproteobacteria bacterium]|nr:cupin domain-containing protein [Gammaproteobacteria bacterium]